MSTQTQAPASGTRPRLSRHHPNDGVLTVIKGLLEVVVIASFIVTFLVQPFRIPTGSMEPTLMVGDFLLVNKQSFGPGGLLDRLVLPPENVRRGDLVVFHFPPDPNRDLVKRVIGIPGDHIHLHDGRVVLNDTLLHEPYAYYSPAFLESFRDDFPSLRMTDPNVDPRWWAELRRIVHNGEVTVPDGHYFVMGDNRNNSEDSRYWGFVPGSAIVGRPLVVYFTTSIPERAMDAGPAARLKGILKQVRVLH